MMEDLSADEFDRLLRKAAPVLSPAAVAARVIGRGRRCPILLTVFRNLAAGMPFTSQEWTDWANTILKAISTLGEGGFEFDPALIFLPTQTPSGATHGPPESGDPGRPIIRMLAQLEAAGHIQRRGSCFAVTAEGKAVLERAGQATE